jgi:protein-S-isoprenylcysteine O-methyltransferase Ste14
VQNYMRRDLFAFAIPAFCIFAAGLAICGWDFVRRFQGVEWTPSWVAVVGALMVVTGIANNIVCQVTMGRSYSAFLVTREDHQLITRGMYGYVRHPIYLGVICVITGIALFTTSLLGLIVLWGVIPFFLRRIRLEERMLVEEFGPEYEAYRERTKKLVPFLY